MDIQAIRKLVREGEHEHLEFKRKVAHPEKIVREIVAFANTKGGQLLIGVDDNGQIPGLKFAEEEIFVLNRALDQLCKPRVKHTHNIIPIDDSEDRSVVIYEIPESNKKPHYAFQTEDEERGKAYVRVADRSIQASREVLEIIRRMKSKKDSGFHYGDKERLLFQYLENHTSISLTEFAKIAHIPKRIASKTLIKLALANVIQVKPSDKEDSYSLSRIEA